MAANIKQEDRFPLIHHDVGSFSIYQRAVDGFINATALCQASSKNLSHYLASKATNDFLLELCLDTGIPVSELVQKAKSGNLGLQGTWLHPQVAINIGEWISPEFAALLYKWIIEWMSGSAASNPILPYHIRRYLVNRNKIPATHFSVLDQVTIKLLSTLESKGYMVPNKLLPDISLGRMFSKWLKHNGYSPNSLPIYEHVFDDGKRPSVQARLYPNELMTSFNIELESWINDGQAFQYFSRRDQRAISPLKEILLELPSQLNDYQLVTGVHAIL